jgi:hypothetical protein
MSEDGSGTLRILDEFCSCCKSCGQGRLEEDLLQQVMSTTLEEVLSPPCLDDVVDYFSLVEEEAEF